MLTERSLAELIDAGQRAASGVRQALRAQKKESRWVGNVLCVRASVANGDKKYMY